MRQHRRGPGLNLLLVVLVPAAVWWALLLGLGLALTGPMAAAVRGEDNVSRRVAAGRTDLWNSITFYWSHIGNTEIVISTCVIVSLLVLWRTRDWQFAIVPPLALLLEAIIFGTVSTLVGRARPPVAELDLAPPTASFPSGHVGGTTAVYLAFALMALSIHRTWQRRLTVAICLAAPLLVAYARLYRGMHHVTDILAGFLSGIVCALLAFGWYRRERRGKGVELAASSYPD